jgi:hypothetical protein
MNKCSRCNKIVDNTEFKTCQNCRNYNKSYRDNITRKYKQGSCSINYGIYKQCVDCKQIKNVEYFYKHKRYYDGYRNQCIECHSARWKKYYVQGYNIILSDKLANDYIYKLKQNMRTYLHQQLNKSNIQKNDNTENIIGCSIVVLKQWLSYQFDENMNWENKTWQIDHVIPVSLFDLKNEYEQKLAFHWTNLQPLYATQNRIKYNKFLPIDYINNLILTCRFIHKNKLDQYTYNILKQRLHWIKSKFSLQHFQIAGKPLEP